MKKLLIAVSVVCSLNSLSAFAFSAKCQISTSRINGMSKNEGIGWQSEDRGDVIHAGVWSKADVTCMTRKGSILTGTMDFAGAGLMTESTPGNNLFISCPLVSEKRLLKRLGKGKRFNIVGVDFAASVVAGVRGGVVVNERGALCSYGAPIFALGANAGFTSIQLKEIVGSTDNSAMAENVSLEMHDGVSDLIIKH